MFGFNDRKTIFFRDLIIIVLSIALAIFITRSGILAGLFSTMGRFVLLGSFIAGIFFVSLFTAAPAIAALIIISQNNSLFWVAFFGGLGALIGDLLIFRFIKDSLSKDLVYLAERFEIKRPPLLFRSKIFGWLVPFLGAVIIASPLPDELGIAMMGLSKVRNSVFIPLSFVLNFLGILVIGYFVKA